MKKNYLLFGITFFLGIWLANSQTIPAGYPAFDDYLRRLQVSGEIDSLPSFMVRPMNPRQFMDVADTYGVMGFSTEENPSGTKLKKVFLNGKSRIQLLPLMNYSEWNVKFPYPQTGPMIPNRGFQTFTSFGVYGEIGPLSVQVQPELIWAQNRYYDFGVPKTRVTEYMERFGEGAYSRLLPGQSSVLLNVGAFSAGISTENIWWGPGQFNALIFSNNAFGFEHATLKTRRPAKTFLGSFEGQLIAGYLHGSEFRSHISNLSRFKDERRYVNGVILTYSPKWVPGLFVGVSRVFQQYESDRGDKFIDYLPILAPFQKVNVGFERDGEGRDQQATFFARWVIPEGNAEVYFEFGRRDHEATWRGAWLNPEHARAYLVGFSKIFQVQNDAGIQVRFEMLQQQESINILARYDGFIGGSNWGGHTPVVNGFTHLGQMIATGIGPSSNIQTLETSWVKGINRIGLKLDRLNRHQDYYVKQFNDLTDEQRWVDLAFTPFAEWKLDRVVVGTRLNFVNSLNYQWQLDENTNDMLRPKGKDVLNFQGNVFFIYPF